MSVDRPCARLLAVVIVMIAAVLAPSAVLAHAGAHALHAHALHGHASLAHVPAPHSLAAQAGTPGKAVILEARVEPAASPERPAAGPCRGLCCGGAVCCATGLPPASGALLLPVPRRLAIVPAATLGRPGIAPEALTEPPRPFA
ncbi:hypothetical protein OPKNFCMD_4774 [Methylobacterium crusticola]|uniref:DUF2946 domain-containing protein n=1 Tax=Methylobacterium crusticola TaxID=1697972 RepID=A0ABQ4R5H9_9HYPH|nr:hypothetical protein [Methylobacterium crusticola]GJD52012.1 hypothetical protein OPKNFCMD_4774 [Methylobacterium crusticola]